MKANEILNKTKSTQESVCVCMIDIDNFKKINDDYGHDIGDQVLIAFTSVISKELNQNEVFGRLGEKSLLLFFPIPYYKSLLSKLNNYEH